MLVGENGSGKSTLVKTLSGVLQPDHGSVAVGGVAFPRLTPRVAISAGIASCFQEVLVEDNLSVMTNLFLWDRGWLRPDTGRIKRREAARAVLAELSKSPPSLDARGEQLSLAAKQLLVVGRALLQDARVYLFDEATAALDQSDSERVLDAIAIRAHLGAAVVFTTHRMEEIEHIAEEILVMRNGEIAGVLSPAAVTRNHVLGLMSGRQMRSEGIFRRTNAPVGAHTSDGRQPKEPSSTQDPAVGVHPTGGAAVLRTVGVKLHPAAAPIDLTLECGKITGFAGLDGHGQEALLRIIGGVERPSAGKVEVRLAGGNWVSLHSHSHSVKFGTVFLPRDRKQQGIFPTLSVLDNFALPTAHSRSHFGFVSWRLTRRAYNSIAARLAIKAASPFHTISSLSGGNQQKVLVARWLEADPRILLFDDPTRGVDISTKIDLYALFRQLADEGKAIIMVSTELEELATLCDRVVVVRSGEAIADMRRSDESKPIERGALLTAILGQPEKDA